MAHRGAAADGAAGPRWKRAHRVGWRPALAQVRRDASYRARGSAARQRPRPAVPGRRQAGGGFCVARPGADAPASRAQGGFRSGWNFQSRPALRRDVMQTGLADFIRDTPEGAEADAILRKCVHCGFCTATCPTYQVLGALEGPLDQVNAAARAVEIIAEDLVSRTGRGAKAAMHALAQDRVGFRAFGRVADEIGEASLHYISG